MTNRADVTRLLSLKSKGHELSLSGDYLDGLSSFLLNMQKTITAHIFFRMFSVLALWK